MTTAMPCDTIEACPKSAHRHMWLSTSLLLSTGEKGRRWQTCKSGCVRQVFISRFCSSIKCRYFPCFCRPLSVRMFLIQRFRSIKLTKYFPPIDRRLSSVLSPVSSSGFVLPSSGRSPVLSGFETSLATCSRRPMCPIRCPNDRFRFSTGNKRPQNECHD